MIPSPNKRADVNQPQIPMEVVEKNRRLVGQGDYLIVKKVKLDDKVYHRVSEYGDIRWEDEDNERLDKDNPELEFALEAYYRKKYFDT